jgi:hypothetical protein
MRVEVGEEPVDGGGAGSQQQFSDLWFKVKVPMALQGIDKHGNQGLKALPADSVGGFP